MAKLPANRQAPLGLPPGSSASVSNAPAPITTFEITEGKCKVCKSPHRREIDSLLATGWSQVAVRSHFNVLFETESDKFTAANMSNHARKHMSSRDAAVRRIMEERAKQIGVDIDNAENFIVTRAAVLDTIIQSGMGSLYRGETVAETREVIAAIQMLDKMEAEWKETAIDEMLSEFRAFAAAVKDVVGENMYDQIYAAFESKMDSKTPGVLTPIPTDVLELMAGEVEEEDEEIGEID